MVLFSYEERTVKELREMCRERGLKVSGLKSEIIKRLRDDNRKKSVSVVKDVTNRSVKELKQTLKNMKCVGYSNMRKDELVKLISTNCVKEIRPRSSRLRELLARIDPETGVIQHNR